MTTFAAKLNRLFEVVHPADRGPYTSSEFCRMVEEGGGKLSVPYLSQLRSGRSSRPAYDMVASIAQTFGVRAEYVSDPLYEREILADLELTRELRESGMLEMARRSTKLSADRRAALAGLLAELEAEDGTEGAAG